MLIDIFKGKATQNSFITILFILTAFAGGYTIMDFPENFLRFFSQPLGQFIVYYSVLYLAYKDDPKVTRMDMALEAIMFVTIMQTLKFTLRRTMS
jgi:hypothetical protein